MVTGWIIVAVICLFLVGFIAAGLSVIRTFLVDEEALDYELKQADLRVPCELCGQRRELKDLRNDVFYGPVCRTHSIGDTPHRAA